MKYKHVFFIWLLADAFLALGLLGFLLYEMFNGGNKNDMEMFLFVMVYGVCISLPSLIVMLLFHFIFIKNAKDKANYKLPYIGLIISINILYLVIGQYGFGMTGEFKLFYIGSTLAGLLAFYFVNKRIRKKAAIVNQ
ncbi:MAG: hypothetical protein RIR31_226 [Bacteroidota bacterium]|jgi:hypothetical protein